MHENFEKNHQGESCIVKFRGSDTFNKNEMTIVLPATLVKESGTKRIKVD